MPPETYIKIRQMYWVYTSLSILVHVLLAPYFLLWPRARQKYLPSLKQRFGLRLPAKTPAARDCIWIHAVSVGEVLAMRNLIVALKAAYPTVRLVLSTVTLSGNKLARQNFPDLTVFFAPIDWGWTVRRFVRTLRPTLFVSAESEFWPNIFRELRLYGSRIVVVNGRVTRTSYRNYRIARPFFHRVLSQADLFLMQSDEDAQRVIGLGVDPAKVWTSGNLKYDLCVDRTPHVERVLTTVAASVDLGPDTLLLVAGSTMAGEERALLDLFRFLRHRHDGLKMILAPRHPERFDQVADLVRDTGYLWIRRSQLDLNDKGAPPRGAVDVLVLDTIGELAPLYQLATVAFVGGSLVDYGGHNILEPAYFGCPVVVGPHMENFKDIALHFLRGKGMWQASNLEELKGMTDRLLSSPEDRGQLGRRAAMIVNQNKGALQNTLTKISALLTPQDQSLAAGSSVPREA